MTDEQMKAMFSPFPKMSKAVRGRKTIHYLQKLKDEGTPIVQHCPSMVGPIFALAAAMADIDILRLQPTDNVSNSAEQAIKEAGLQIGKYRSMSPMIHINYVTDTEAFYCKEAALKNFSNFHYADADSILPMGINNETLKYVSDNHCAIYGHVGALSGWQTMPKYGGYKRMGKTAEDAMEVFKTAYEYQENGMKAMSVELTPGEVSAAIAKKMRVPVIGIAAGTTGNGVTVDGYEMVDTDLFGLMSKPASHAKTYGNFLQFAYGVYAAWANDVRTKAYPTEENGFHMDPAELEKFNEMIEKF